MKSTTLIPFSGGIEAPVLCDLSDPQLIALLYFTPRDRAVITNSASRGAPIASVRDAHERRQLPAVEDRRAISRERSQALKRVGTSADAMPSLQATNRRHRSMP